MQFPGRSHRPPDPHGRQVTADTSRAGHVDDGSIAYAERVEQARRAWPEANPDDFERIGKRRYRDRGSGIELVALREAPLLAIGQEETRGATCFFVSGGRITVLRPEAFEQPLVGAAGYVRGQQVVAGNGPATGGVHIL